MRSRAGVKVESLESRHLLAAVGPSALTASAGVTPGEISSKVFDVKLYGAKGNSTTDDKAAINRAISAMKSNGGGTLLFPTGIYRISSALRISSAGKFIISAVGATLKPFGNVSPNYATGDILQLSNCYSFTVNGMTFDGNERSRGGGFPAESLRIDGASDFRITGCKFTDAVLDDVYVAANSSKISSRDGVIENSTFDGARRNSISVIAAQRLEITNNKISNVRGAAPGDGVIVEANSTDAEGANKDILINRNTFTNIADAGVSVIANKNPRRITVDSNEFINCPTGVRINGDYCVVSNNYFHDSAKPSSGYGSGALGQITIGGYNGTRVTIDANRIERFAGMSGIYLHVTWVGESFITNNTVSGITDSKYNAIAVWSANAHVTGNGVSNCAGIGIGVSANNADIGSNTLSTGGHSGIYYNGSGGSIWRNTVIEYGMATAGMCIAAVGGTVGCNIRDNVIRNWSVSGWTGIRFDAKDILSGNTLQGVL